jgi:hypothetical protein
MSQVIMRKDCVCEITRTVINAIPEKVVYAFWVAGMVEEGDVGAIYTSNVPAELRPRLEQYIQSGANSEVDPKDWGMTDRISLPAEIGERLRQYLFTISEIAYVLTVYDHTARTFNILSNLTELGVKQIFDILRDCPPMQEFSRAVISPLVNPT